jgi:polysaccharide export outer membrane protein
VRRKISCSSVLFLIVSCTAAGASAQQIIDLNTPTAGNPQTLIPTTPPAPTANQQPVVPAPVQQPEIIPQPARPNYELGPNDQIMIRAFQVDEINEKPFKIEADGMITLPLVGTIKAGGLTVGELEAELVDSLKKYVKNPQATVILIQFRSSPVFFVGAFAKPGAYPMEGRRTLVEMLTQVGGVSSQGTRRIKLTRKSESGPIPLPNAVEDPGNKVSTVEISMSSLQNNINPAEDIELKPYDVISAEVAEKVYLQGGFPRTGAFPLDERDSISVMQLISLAGGLTPDAEKDKAVILRPVMDTARRAQIHLDLEAIMQAKANDYPLMANDILYVPVKSGSSTKWKRGGKVALTVLPATMGVLFLILSRI